MEDKIEYNDIRDLVKEIKNVKSRIFYSRSTKCFYQIKDLNNLFYIDLSYDISQYSGIDTSVEEELINTLLKELGK